jgi:hypothetical protein
MVWDGDERRSSKWSAGSSILAQSIRQHAIAEQADRESEGTHLFSNRPPLDLSLSIPLNDWIKP